MSREALWYGRSSVLVPGTASAAGVASSFVGAYNASAPNTATEINIIENISNKLAVLTNYLEGNGIALSENIAARI